MPDPQASILSFIHVRSHLSFVPHLYVPRFHPSSRATTMAFPSVEFGDLSLHDLDLSRLPEPIRKLCGLA